MFSQLLWSAALTGLARLVQAEFGIAGDLFQLQNTASVNNAKLSWAIVNGANAYRVESTIGEGGSWQTLGTVPGNTFDSYNLAVGSAYTFRVTALNGETEVDKSTAVPLTPYTPLNSYLDYDNTSPSTLRRKSELLVNGVYYQYTYETQTNGSFSRFVEQTSSDGLDFSGDKTVLTSEILCAPANYSCKLERVQFRQHPSSGEFVMWAHYERSQDYGLGWVAVAHIKPGASSMTFAGAFAPNGDDSRDMAFFADGTDAYLVTSTNVNTNNNIYRLSSDWTKVDSFLVQVNAGGHREAPSVIKSNGWYYLFTSGASGWLPSQPQYIAAQAMAGPWGPPTTIGSTSTFGSQSGGVNEFGTGHFAMNADRWSNNWPTKGGPNRQLMLPMGLSAQGGFASCSFYHKAKYSEEAPAGQNVYGIQTGQILSVGKPASSSAGAKDIAFANDGIQTDVDATFVPSSVPFWYQIDLQQAYTISQIDLTTKIVPGSDTFYHYNVTGSSDGKYFSLLLADMHDSVDVGFSVAFATSTEKVRYVRVYVDGIINNVNGNEADWTVGINEVTVYGS